MSPPCRALRGLGALVSASGWPHLGGSRAVGGHGEPCSAPAGGLQMVPGHSGKVLNVPSANSGDTLVAMAAWGQVTQASGALPLSGMAPAWGT